MGDAFNPPGGKGFGTPDFSDAIPPDPIRQGSMGPEGVGSNRTTPTTFESGQAPQATASDESDWDHIGDNGLGGTMMQAGDVADTGPGSGLRGFRTTPIGGSYNPGQGKTSGSGGVERSNAS